MFQLVHHKFDVIKLFSFFVFDYSFLAFALSNELFLGKYLTFFTDEAEPNEEKGDCWELKEFLEVLFAEHLANFGNDLEFRLGCILQEG